MRLLQVQIYLVREWMGGVGGAESLIFRSNLHEVTLALQSYLTLAQGSLFAADSVARELKALLEHPSLRMR